MFARMTPHRRPLGFRILAGCLIGASFLGLIDSGPASARTMESVDFHDDDYSGFVRSANPVETVLHPLWDIPPIGDGEIKDPPPRPIALADLVIDDITFGSERQGATTRYYLDAHIRNRGTARSGVFLAVEWQSRLSSWIGVLEPGQTVLHRWYRDSCESSGTVVLDWANMVAEFSETNNARDWVKIC